jgi:PAS domain S-box-containing protein
MLASVLNPASYRFNPYAIPNFATAAAILLLGLIVLVRERASVVSRLFFLVTLTTGLWLFCFSWLYCAVKPDVAIWWTKVGHLGIVLIPSSVYHFTLSEVNLYSQNTKLAWTSLAVSLLFFTAILWTDVFITGLYRYDWGYYTQYGWLSFPFLAYFLTMLLRSLHHYWKDYQRARAGTHRRRIKAVMIAFAIAYTGSIDYLPAFGIAIYPFGYLAVLAFIVLMAHAIWRYRLVDITPAFAAAQIIDTMTDALLVLDLGGVIRIVNRATCGLLGKSEVELVGKPISAMNRTFFSFNEVDSLVRGGIDRDYEVTLPAEQGEAVTLSVSASVMRGPSKEPLAIVCVARDVTGRKVAEAQIQRHREREAALHEINLATTSTLELHTVLDMLLQKIEHLFPYSIAITVRLFHGVTKQLEPIASRNLDDEEWKSEEWEAVRAFTSQVFHTQKMLLIADIRSDPRTSNPPFFRRHGLVSYLGVPLIAKSETLGVLSFYTKQGRSFSNEEMDFLSTLASQAAMAIQNSQLYEQTKRQAVELERANRVKDEFLSVMSHELRTPLNLVMGYTEMIKDRMLGEINPEQDRILGKLLGRARDLLFMISGILEATNIGSKTATVNSTEFDLSDFLNELKLAYELPLGNDLTLDWEIPSDLPVMKTDREKLRHILQNLINNALKFTNDGQILVATRYLAATKMVEFKVSDTGIGIPNEALPFIFEMFHQVDSSETRNYGGVGLGLYIAKKFTELLGGKVEGESQIGRGSTFTVALPLIHVDERGT